MGINRARGSDGGSDEGGDGGNRMEVIRDIHRLPESAHFPPSKLHPIPR